MGHKTAIQLARLSGFSPIIATASLRNESLLKSIGATHVIDRSLPPSDILHELPKLTGGKPIVLAYDAISTGKTTQHLAYDALASGGGLVVVDPWHLEILAEKIKEGDQKRIARPRADLQHPANKALGVELYERLTEWLKTGAIVVCILLLLSRQQCVNGRTLIYSRSSSRTALSYFRMDCWVSQRDWRGLREVK